MSNCFGCPNLEKCLELGITPEECDTLNLNDPDFEDVVYGQKHNEFFWKEMSYAKYVEDEMDYGDLSEEEYEKENG